MYRRTEVAYGNYPTAAPASVVPMAPTDEQPQTETARYAKHRGKPSLLTPQGEAGYGRHWQPAPVDPLPPHERMMNVVQLGA